MRRAVMAGVVACVLCGGGAVAQPGGMERGQPGGGRGMGPGGGMGPNAPERKVLKQFDADKDGVLGRGERDRARAWLKENGGRGRPGGPGGPPGPRMGPRDGGEELGKPGERVSPGDVAAVKGGLYDLGAFRTLFIDLEDEEWEAELADFYHTDVEVPATLTVDGTRYEGVGVAFRGASSFFSVPAGRKRSLNISMDLTKKDQRLLGKKTLNLLNSNGDASFMSTVLYSRVANGHIAAPRANYVRVVINGESWGVYVNVEQFDRLFVQERFEGGRDAEGARWKVKGSPQGDAGLNFVGEDVNAYRQRYQIKSKDQAEDWDALVELCRVLSTAPLEELEARLAPMLDIEGALRFLALDTALVNSDGYWVRASDYSLYRDSRGVFHVVPHDMNEAFSGRLHVGGPGRRGPGERAPRGEGPGPEDRPERAQRGAGAREGAREGARAGFELDPMVGMEDDRKPLRSRLLAVPSLRARYLEKVRALAEELDWERLGPTVAEVRGLIRDQVRADTRKLTPFEGFERATGAEGVGGSLREFMERRRAYLLKAVEAAGAADAADAGEAAGGR